MLHFTGAYNSTSLTYGSLAYNTLAIPYFGAHNSTSMLTHGSLSRAGYPLYNRIAFNSAPFNDKLAISFYYFICLVIASYFLYLLTIIEYVLPEALLVSL